MNMLKELLLIVWLSINVTDAFGQTVNNKIPIVYSPHYDISFFGIEKLHPFDSAKYGKVYKYLVGKVGIKRDAFFTPAQITTDELLTVHSKEYLASLEKSFNVARIAEIGELSFMPNFLLQHYLLKPVRFGTGGTILGAELALKYGWAINLSGGYHHAKANSGGGFCFFADIPIAVQKLWEKDPSLKVLIVDLDAHQGNGYEYIFKNDFRISMFDVYNDDIYPADNEAKKYITFNFPVKSFIEDKEYLSLLGKELPVAIKKSRPNLIIYIAGTDIFEGDSLGRMNISEQGIIKRDEIVFKVARANNVAILMTLGGGYSKENAKIIGRSIENLLRNVINHSDLRLEKPNSSEINHAT